MINKLNKTVKSMKWWDISLVKLSVLFATLVVLKLFPAFLIWVNNTNIWVFIIMTLIFMARPIYLWLK